MKTLTCALRHMRYPRCHRLAQPVRVSNEDATVGLLVVQGRRFRPIPGKVPQAAAPLTGHGQGGARPLFCFPQAAFDEIQPVNGASAAHSRMTRSCIAVRQMSWGRRPVEPRAGIRKVNGVAPGNYGEKGAPVYFWDP